MRYIQSIQPNVPAGTTCKHGLCKRRVSCSFLTLSLSLVGHSPQRTCVSVHVVTRSCFPLGSKGTFNFRRSQPLLRDVYHIKNGGCLLEVFIVRLFNRTLSTYYTLLSNA